MAKGSPKACTKVTNEDEDIVEQSQSTATQESIDDKSEKIFERNEITINGSTIDEENGDNSQRPPLIIDCGLVSSPKTRDLSGIVAKEDGFEDGYDSDGEIGPFYDAVEEEGEQVFDEPMWNETGGDEGYVSCEESVTDSTKEAPVEAINEDEMLPTNIDLPVNIDSSVLMGFNVKTLKEELRIRQQSMSGNKAVLQYRLKHSLTIPVISVLIGGAKSTKPKQKIGKPKKGKPKSTKGNGMKWFSDDAFWTELN